MTNSLEHEREKWSEKLEVERKEVIVSEKQVREEVEKDQEQYEKEKRM